MTLFICLLIKFLSELPLEYKVYGGRDSTCLIHHWILLAYYNIWHSGTPLQYSCLKNPWMEEPGRLQSMGSWRVGYDWATSLSLFTFMHWRRKWQPTLVFLSGESQGHQNPESGGLPSMGSHRVGHGWRNLAAAAAEIIQSLISNFS